jgi:hypothetical protein
MDNKILIEYAEGEIEVYRKIASSDNPDVDPTIVTESKAEIKHLQNLMDCKDYDTLEEYYKEEKEWVQDRGINDAKAGLPCDASKTRVTANYYGKFVNDYYRGYKLGEATNG